MFYVYTYLREDGSPYYFGKGKDLRAWSRQRTINRPPNDRIKFVVKNVDEELAHFVECEAIALYGRKDKGTGILWNLTDGGEGTSGRIIPSEESNRRAATQRGKPKNLNAEQRLHRSGIRKGKTHSDETKAKMSAAHSGVNNHNFGKKLTVSPEHRKNLSKAMRNVPKIKCSHCDKAFKPWTISRHNKKHQLENK